MTIPAGSIDVQLTEIRGQLQTLNVRLDGHMRNLEDKVVDNAKGLDTHVHHPNPHSEQEAWLRRLVEAHSEALAERVKLVETNSDLLQRRADELDGSLKVLKWLLGVVGAAAIGEIATLIAQWPVH